MIKKSTFVLLLCCFLAQVTTWAQAPFLTATPSTLNVRATGDTAFFVVTTTDSTWTTSTVSLPQGFSITPLSGRRGSTTVRVIAAAYTGTTARTLSINISSQITPNLLHYATVSILQAAATSPVVTACSDSTEPNNSVADAFDWGALNASTRLLSPLCLTNADIDFVKFTINGTRFYARVRGFSTNTMGRYGLEAVVAGNVLTLRTVSVSGSNTDTYLSLLDANGNVLEENDDLGGTFFSSVSYNVVNPTSLSVSRNSLTIAPTGSSDTFLVTSANVRWTITGAPTWLTVTPTTDSLTGTRTVVVSAAANTATLSRTAYLTVAAGSRSFRVFVLQGVNTPVQTPCLDGNEPNNTASLATNAVLTNNTFTDSTACLSPTGDEDFYRFSLNGSVFYAKVRGFSTSTVGKYGLRITTQGAGVSLTTFSISGSNTDTYLFLIDANGVVLASNDDYNGTLFSNINFNTALRVSPTSLSFSAGGGTQTVSIYSNAAWTMSVLPSWLTASARTGATGSNSITLTAAANADSVARSVTLSITNATTASTVNVTQATAPRVANCNDPYEPNNTLATAVNIGTVTAGNVWSSNNLCLTAGDNDYLSFTYNNTAYYAYIRGFSPNTSGLYGLRISADTSELLLQTYSVDSRTTDTYLYLLNAAGATLASNDDYGGTFFSQVNYNFTPTGGGGGVVANDEPCGAITLTATATPNCIAGNNTGATTTASPAPVVFATGVTTSLTAANDVWFRCVVPASGVVTIRTTAATLSDAVMAIYASDSCGRIGATALAMEDDNSGNSGSSSFLMPVLTVRQPTGTQLWIRIWGFASRTGTFNVCALNFDTANIIGGGGGSGNALRVASGTQGLRAFPNPAQQQLQVLFTASTQTDGVIEMFDVLGRKVLTQNATFQVGDNAQSVDVSALQTGIYILKVGDERLKIQVVR